jgi:hypothetical protein
MFLIIPELTSKKICCLPGGGNSSKAWGPRLPGKSTWMLASFMRENRKKRELISHYFLDKNADILS